jgi:hypothetical protein
MHGHDDGTPGDGGEGWSEGWGEGWGEALAALRRKAAAWQGAGPMPDPLRREDGERAFARLRVASRRLFEAARRAYRDLCPEGYPQIEDNGIPGPGGAIGLRLGPHHAFFCSLEHVRQKARRGERTEGLAGALGLSTKKRLPGDPLPPAGPDQPVRLALLALRWDAAGGWSEVRRVLDPRWDEALLFEHLGAFLLGFGYDATLAAPAAGTAPGGAVDGAEARRAPR